MTSRLVIIMLNIPVLLINFIEAGPVSLKLVHRLADVRNRRQAGYVYNRPSVSFDLPTRGTTAVTQGMNFDRTPAQQMYYAYPVPSSGGGEVTGGVVNIDNAIIGSTGGTSNAAATGGYSYGMQQTSLTQTTSTTGPAYNAGVTQSQSTTVVQGTSNTGYQGSTTGRSGYDYNSPSTTSDPRSTLIIQSTNAPEYLPPSRGGAVNIGGGGGGSTVTLGSTSSYGPTSAGTTTTTGNPGMLPSAYLPPLSPAPSPSTLPTTVGSTTVTAGTLPTLNTGYLPPVSSPFPVFPPATLPSSTYSPSPSTPSPLPPATPSAGYLPPSLRSGSQPTQILVSTPAPTYLPPLI